MGFRFRKSVNLGPLRVNFSKSGVGYSVGGKGFRATKKQVVGSAPPPPSRAPELVMYGITPTLERRRHPDQPLPLPPLGTPIRPHLLRAVKNVGNGLMLWRLFWLLG